MNENKYLTPVDSSLCLSLVELSESFYQQIWEGVEVIGRYKVLELVMKKLLNQTDTAEFVVAFAGIQDAIHQFGEQKKLKKLYPAVPSPLKGSGSSSW